MHGDIEDGYVSRCGKWVHDGLNLVLEPFFSASIFVFDAMPRRLSTNVLPWLGHPCMVVAYTSVFMLGPLRRHFTVDPEDPLLGIASIAGLFMLAILVVAMCDYAEVELRRRDAVAAREGDRAPQEP